MPREASITYEQVAAAAAAIEAAGGKPNQRNVRERLGTGSMGTINRLVRQYLDSKAGPANTPVTLPSALQHVITEYLAQEIGGAKEELELKLSAAKTEARDLADDNERLSRLVESLEGEISTLREERATLIGRVSQLESDLTVSREETAEERRQSAIDRAQLTRAVTQLEAMPGLNDEITKLRAALDAERTGRSDAEKRAATAEALSTGLAARLKDAVEQHTQMLTNYDVQLNRAIQANSKLEDEKHRLESELSNYLNDARSSTEKIGRLEGQVDALTRQIAEQAEHQR